MNYRITSHLNYTIKVPVLGTIVQHIIVILSYANFGHKAFKANIFAILHSSVLWLLKCTMKK